MGGRSNFGTLALSCGSFSGAAVSNPLGGGPRIRGVDLGSFHGGKDSVGELCGAAGTSYVAGKAFALGVDCRESFRHLRGCGGFF